MLTMTTTKREKRITIYLSIVLYMLKHLCETDRKKHFGRFLRTKFLIISLFLCLCAFVCWLLELSLLYYHLLHIPIDTFFFVWITCENCIDDSIVHRLLSCTTIVFTRFTECIGIVSSMVTVLTVISTAFFWQQLLYRHYNASVLRIL